MRLILIPVYSYWKIYVKGKTKIEYIGTSRLIQGESEAQARARITKQYEEEL